MHDARILRKSGLWREVEEEGRLFPGRKRVIAGHDMGYYILGDAAYPLTSWLMKPFMDNGHLDAQHTTITDSTCAEINLMVLTPPPHAVG